MTLEEEFFAEVCDTVFSYVHGDAPDPAVAVHALGHNLARVLVHFIRARHLLADEVESVLATVCDRLRETTYAFLQNADAGEQGDADARG